MGGVDGARAGRGELADVLPLRPGADRSSPLRILAIGAHSDDIELGAGGTVLRLIREWRPVHVDWVVLAARGERAREAHASAASFLAGAGSQSVAVHEFPDGRFPYVGADIKAVFEQLKGAEPDVVLTHRREDVHQDHRLVAELTWQTFRNHLILEYEIVKYEGDLGTPNLFVPLERGDVARKVELLMDVFPSQRDRSWFGEDTFRAILRLRGVESASPTGFAEAFTCRKVVI